jgi:hypothetical protein
VEVWVKRRDWVKQWSWDVRRDVSGSFFCRRAKATVVPLGDKASPKMSNKRGPGGQPVPNRRALWDLMLKHYGGAVAKVKGEPVKIAEKGR